MYEARFSDFVHGKATCQGETPEEACRKAYRKIAESWWNPETGPIDEKLKYPTFDFQPVTDDVREVYVEGFLTGTVKEVK